MISVGFFILGMMFYAGAVAIIKYIKSKRTNKKYVTFTKRWFRIILINSIIWVYLSFILAFADKTQIAETISVQSIITIIGAFTTYALKSAYEKNIGKEKEYHEYKLETEINEP